MGLEMEISRMALKFCATVPIYLVLFKKINQSIIDVYMTTVPVLSCGLDP